MTHDDVIRLARQVADPDTTDPLCGGDQRDLITLNLDEMVRFAALAAAHEREQCALVVENCCSYCAERIRERDGKPRKPMQHAVSVDDITKAALKILDAELTKQGLKP